MNPPVNPLEALITQRIAAEGGWLAFDCFMAMALYEPGMGYYANDLVKLGHMPQSGSDFVTAPELSAQFGHTVAVQVAEALRRTDTREVWEFGAGSGALAQQILTTLAAPSHADLADCSYTIVELSATLRARQQATLAPWGNRVRWVAELPPQMQGVVVCNELLDAMPVKLLARVGGAWNERGVVLHEGVLHWADMPTPLRPPFEVEGDHDYLSEIHPQAEAFIHTLGDRLSAGALLLIDYGFPEAEYYHPQRHMGTLMCHQAHTAGGHPLREVGLKDITAHVNFTGIALAGQNAGFEVLGYTSQARFLINCGLLLNNEQQSQTERANNLKLINEHEMGELFKVVMLGKGEMWIPLGFVTGDRTGRL